MGTHIGISWDSLQCPRSLKDMGFERCGDTLGCPGMSQVMKGHMGHGT